MAGLRGEFVRRVLGRGESLVAGAGLSLGVMLLVGLGALAWWQGQLARDEAQTSLSKQATAVLDTIADASASLLAGGDLSAVRRLVLDAGHHDAIAEARLVLGDGTVLAHSKPGRIDTQVGLESWPTLPLDAAGGDGFTRRVEVPGTGAALLEIEVSPVIGTGSFETQIAVAAAGACLLGGLLLVYRTLRRRLAPLDAVRSALVQLAQGERRPEVLRLSEGLGDEALAWNELLSEREARQASGLRERAGEALSGRTGRGGELGEACDALWYGLVILSDKGAIRYANGAASVFLGVLRDELRGMQLAELVGSDGLGEAIARLARGESKRRVSIEIERTGQSEGILRFGLRPIKRDDQKLVMVLIEDITQQRVAEKSRSEFVAQATHELRTPLTNIRLYVEEALDLGDEDAAERSRCLNVINSETRRLERVVGDMLSVSEIEAGSLRLNEGDVRVDALVADLRQDYDAQAREKQITLKFDVSPKLPVLRGDREKLAISLHNLVGNALKYTPAGGTVEVAVDADEQNFSFVVSDTGIGISPKDQARIFERFTRAQDKRVAEITGTGLGLALAREFARLHGGDISVESEIDKGSTFSLVVPVRTPQDTPARAA